MNPSDVLLLYRSDFRTFVQFLFHEAYPGQPFVDSWHLDVVADALSNCSPGSGARLMLNLPPRSLKSFVTSVAWPLFLLGRTPELKITVICGTQDLANELGELREQLLRSPRLLTVFPNLVGLVQGQTRRFAGGGSLLHAFIGRSQIGRGSDLIIIDDPLTPAQAHDAGRRDDVNTRYASEIAPRLNDSGSVIVIVMQRLHVDDLCGRLLKGGEPWRQVAMSAVARTDEVWTLTNGVIHRRNRGEPLCAVRAGLPVLRDQLRRSGAVTFSAQYLQRPLDLPPTATHRVECMFKALVALPGHEHRTPPRMGMMRIPLEADIRATYFGDPRPLDFTGFREMTAGEFEKQMIEQQAMMIAEMREDANQRRR